MAKKFSQQIYSLQALRGLAALGVVLYHLDKFSQGIFNKEFFSSLFSFGYSGVDIFFVLSGFIIFYVNRDSFGKKTLTKNYLLKRLTRIYPIYWFICLFIIPLFFFFPKYGQGYETDIRSIAASLVLIPQNHDPIISVAWTLIHEIKFYLLFSLVIFFGLKKSFKFFLPLLVISFIDFLFRLRGIVIFHNPILANFFSFLNLEFAFGCLAAYLVGKIKLQRAYIPLSISILLFLIGAYVYETRFYNLRDAGRVIFYGIPSFGIVTSLAKMELSKNIKVGKTLVILGDSSYSIYLIHQTFIAAILRSAQHLAIIDRLNSIVWLIGLGLASCLVGILINVSVEKPLIIYSRKIIGISK